MQWIVFTRKAAIQVLLIFALSILLASCARKTTIERIPTVPSSTKKEIQAAAKKTLDPKIAFAEALLKSSPWKDHLVGFVLYDLEDKKYVIRQNEQKYFTPASNIKLFTFYAALNILTEYETLFEYAENDTQLFFRGTGHPAFLHPYLPEHSQAFDLLNTSKKQLIFCPSNFEDEAFSPGWAIDDATYYYQVDKAAMPLFGNRVWLSRPIGSNRFQSVPKHFQNKIQRSKETFKVPKRSLYENIFLVSDSVSLEKEWSIDLPFIHSDALVLDLLSDTLNRKISRGNTPLTFKSLKDYPTAELYKALLIHSDNGIAEQLLLMCSHQVFDTMNTQKIIEHVLENSMQAIPDPPRWVDGSGLSRYNLSTPRSMVWVLEKIERRIGEDRIQTLFETIKLNDKGAVIYAKTGSLSNNFNLSGYITGASGKRYAFSFMNNHFLNSRKNIYSEVKKYLLEIQQTY